jgi:DNA excision repair protein ERCC-1
MTYYTMYPEYIFDRLKRVGNNFSLRILMLLIDIVQHYSSWKNLMPFYIDWIPTNIEGTHKICLYFKLDHHTSLEVRRRFIISALFKFFSLQEAARYVETFKIMENRPADKIKEKKKDEFVDQAVNFLTKIPSINSTDAMSLLMHFGVRILYR